MRPGAGYACGAAVLTFTGDVTALRFSALDTVRTSSFTLAKDLARQPFRARCAARARIRIGTRDDAYTGLARANARAALLALQRIRLWRHAAPIVDAGRIFGRSATAALAAAAAGGARARFAAL